MSLCHQAAQVFRCSIALSPQALVFQSVNPTERFAELVSGPETALDLDELVLLIAAHANPELDINRQLGRLDAIAEEVEQRDLDGLRRHLFGEMAFGGNAEEYYDPANSFLDVVLERRVGIPITLAVLMIEVGRRIDVPLAGVSMPGHFLVRDLNDKDVFIDPYNRGLILDAVGCEESFFLLQGPQAVFDPSFLDVVGPLEIISRMLSNLERATLMTNNLEMLAWVLRLVLAMPGVEVSAYRRLAKVLAALGKVSDAAEIWDQLAAEAFDDQVKAHATQAARELRASLN